VLRLLPRHPPKRAFQGPSASRSSRSRNNAWADCHRVSPYLPQTRLLPSREDQSRGCLPIDLHHRKVAWGVSPLFPLPTCDAAIRCGDAEISASMSIKATYEVPFATAFLAPLNPGFDTHSPPDHFDHRPCSASCLSDRPFARR
jgi:hypothetical protein